MRKITFVAALLCAGVGALGQNSGQPLYVFERATF